MRAESAAIKCDIALVQSHPVFGIDGPLVYLNMETPSQALIAVRFKAVGGKNRPRLLREHNV